MSDIVIIALVSGLPPTIAAIAAAVTSVRNHNTLINQDKKLEEIHKCVDKIIK